MLARVWTGKASVGMNRARPLADMTLQGTVSFATCAVLAFAVALIAFDCAEAAAGRAFLHDARSCAGCRG